MFAGIIILKIKYGIVNTLFNHEDYAEKIELVDRMEVVHGVCFAILAIVENHKLNKLLESCGWNLLWIKTLAKYTNICMN
jgi:hypothetical protein